jgi:DNA-binding winged helix-turn-helix (wHTH) protein
MELKQMAIEGSQSHKRRKLQRDNNEEDERVENVDRNGDSMSQPTQIDEDQKIWHESIRQHEKRHEEMLAAVQANTDAVKALHQDIIRLLQKKN